MTAASFHQLPDLNRLNQRLAQQTIRIHSFLEVAAPQIDALLQAVEEDDRAEVGRICREIHRSSDLYGYYGLSQRASQACEAVAACHTAAVIGGKVAELVSEFDRTGAQSLIN